MYEYVYVVMCMCFMRTCMCMYATVDVRSEERHGSVVKSRAQSLVIDVLCIE